MITVTLQLYEQSNEPSGNQAHICLVSATLYLTVPNNLNFVLDLYLKIILLMLKGLSKSLKA